jgi:hypothetical protein
MSTLTMNLFRSYFFFQPDLGFSYYLNKKGGEMKIKSPVHQLFLVIAFFICPFILFAQISDEQKQTLCQNNKDTIKRLEKKINDLEKTLRDISDSKKKDQIRSDYNDVISAIKNLERFKANKPVPSTATDEQYTIEMLDPIYDMEKNYTGKETLTDIVTKDFKDNGELIGAQPTNTIRVLRMIRDAIAKKIDGNAKLEPEGIKNDLKDARYKLSYHQNRMIELKCDEAITKTEETEKKDSKTDEKNPSPSEEVPLPSQIELTEHTDKWGTFTATLKYNSKTGNYDGTYSNGGKDEFQLRIYDGQNFFMARIKSFATYSGKLADGKISGSATIGGQEGTFTATIK